MRTIVTEDNLIKTYSKKESTNAMLFKDAFKLRKEQKLGSKLVARYLRCERHLTRDWFYFNQKPYPIKAIEFLEERDLLPLQVGLDSKFILLTKLLGFLFGDGNLRHVCFYMGLTGQEYDLIRFRTEIKNNLNINCKLIEASGVGKAFTLKLYSAPLGRLLYCMGAPLGDKLLNPFQVPEWLISAPVEIKRVFLDTLFSNEISTPSLNTDGYFKAPELVMWKVEDYLPFHIIFMDQIRMLLKEFNIEARLIDYTKFSYIRKRDKKRIVGYGIRIYNNHVNLYNFLSQFNFELCSKKSEIANNMLEILKEKL